VDYPKSVPGVGLVNGKFADEDAASGRLGSLIPSAWGNGVTDEVLAMIGHAGLQPNEADLTQLLQAILAIVRGATGGAYVVDTGVANAYAVAYSPAVTALVDGMVLRFRAKAANSAASTLSVNGLAAKPILGGAHAALAGGEIVAGGICEAVWNAPLASYVLRGCTGGALQVATPTQSNHAAPLSAVTGKVSKDGSVPMTAALQVGAAGADPNGTYGPGWVELMSSSGSYIDFKRVASDDYEWRVMDSGGLVITYKDGTSFSFGANGNAWFPIINSLFPGTTDLLGALTLLNNKIANQISLGVGQTWQNLTASRALNTTYTNTTGKPIAVSIGGGQSGGSVDLIINGVTMGGTALGNQSQVFGVVPVGATYSTTTGTNYNYWYELR
jgi:hypothetical protein